MLKPLRVLCLHGYRQDHQSFREKSGGFRKMFKNKLDFLAMDAPHVVPKGAQNETGDSCHRSWWFSSFNDVDFFSSREYTDTEKGFQESLDAIDAKVEEDGPFDGILGFSQGGAMAAILAATKKYNFKFAILIASFRSRSSTHDKYYTDKVDIPSLHIIGETDNVVLKEVSEQLLEYFVNPITLYHPGGHCIPSSSRLKEGIIDFICQINKPDS